MAQSQKTSRFLDPSQILAYAGLQPGNVVADFGCGNGFYPVAAAKLVGDTGTIYAVDIKKESLEATVSAAKHEGLANIYSIRHDVELPGVDVAPGSCDAVILAGILHTAKLQKNVLKETYRVLRTGGKVIVIEWKKEKLPFGPNIENRVSEQDVNDLMSKSSFRFIKEMPADAFHYALVFQK
ncbi:MAG: type 11 methyltransferase [Candidatus Doudnabacteria bacterium]|nr:type 11 methyltransferase [Candidatus Doudnabacteria bacterium]